MFDIICCLLIMKRTIEYSDKVIADIARRESQIEGPDDFSQWIAYDSGLKRMDFGFKYVLNALGFFSLQGVRDVLTQTDRQPTGLELAGQGKTFIELGIDGVACCLAIPSFLAQPADDETRLRRKKLREDETTVALVAGDLGQPSTFEGIRTRFRQEKIEKPNIILLTPAGGLGYLPEQQEFIDRIIKPAIGLCDSDHFAFIGEAPEGTKPHLRNFLETLRADTGAQTTIRKCGETQIFGIYRNKST